jgi:hypothetical protein
LVTRGVQSVRRDLVLPVFPKEPQVIPNFRTENWLLETRRGEDKNQDFEASKFHCGFLKIVSSLSHHVYFHIEYLSNLEEYIYHLHQIAVTKLCLSFDSEMRIRFKLNTPVEDTKSIHMVVLDTLDCPPDPRRACPLPVSHLSAFSAPLSILPVPLRRKVKSHVTAKWQRSIFSLRTLNNDSMPKTYRLVSRHMC